MQRARTAKVQAVRRRCTVSAAPPASKTPSKIIAHSDRVGTGAGGAGRGRYSKLLASPAHAARFQMGSARGAASSMSTP